MKRTWFGIGMISLSCAVLAAILKFAQVLSDEQYKAAFLICSIIWFIAAYFWVNNKKEETTEI